MCGLVGVAGSISKQDVDAFTDLIVVNSVRGTSSTGVAAVERAKGAEVNVTKEVGDPFVLVGSKQWERTVRVGNKVLLGHNRAATIGKVSRFNAHPFEFRNVVGAHNGTLDYECRRRLAHHDRFDTDSEALFDHMNIEGPEQTIPLLLGAWALTWYDREHNTMCFIRNSERPLSYCFTDDRKGLYWASEPLMLKWILSRKGIRVDHDTIYAVNNDTLMEIEIPDYGQPFGQFERSELKGAEKPVYAGYQGAQGARNFTNGTKTGTNVTQFPAANRGKIGPSIAKAHERPLRDHEYLLFSDNKILEGRRNVYCNGEISGKATIGELIDFTVFYQHPSPLGSLPAPAGHNLPAVDDHEEEGSAETPLSQSSEGRQTEPSVSDASENSADGEIETPWEEEAGESPSSFFHGYGGKFVSETEFTVACGGHCGWCGDPVTPRTKGRWYDPTTFIEESCFANNDEIKDMFPNTPTLGSC